ncbi:hypothetical protein HMPREF1398_01126 [Helicobacter pylori GAM117Ai]|nr:hypothetical protein HMPREF1398_01126 [Helicobacter pylori GAM117Ai]
MLCAYSFSFVALLFCLAWRFAPITIFHFSKSLWLLFSPNKLKHIIQCSLSHKLI